MDSVIVPTPSPDSAVGERKLPFWRQFAGLQGRLIFGFSVLLMIALATSSILFVRKSRDALSDILGEQARQIAQTLAMAAETPYETDDVEELQRLGRDLLRSRNIVLVAFYDPAGQPLSVACRDPDFNPQEAGVWDQPNTQHLMQVRQLHAPALGDFLQLTAPVLDTFAEHKGRDQRQPGNAAGNTRLLGYLTVGISQNNEQARLKQVSLLGVGVGCLIFLVSLPVVSGLVHRIILPIRHLAAASNQIAAGDYDVHVATERPDEIGTLARSFNEMALKIRQHQQELRIANANLAEANRDLEQKVQQRTAELESSNRRLSAEISEKEEFLRAVSHDLNAPLRNIGGMATMLLMKGREKFDEDVIHRLERIQKNVEVETDLIAELLELSRIKTRRQKMEQVDLDPMVHDLEGVFENDLRQKQIALTIDTPLPPLVCERNRLRQVFQNLIDNAIKYMGEGPMREIHVGCDQSDDELEYYVRDTGIGIDKEDLGKVFCVFRRGRNTAAVSVAGKGVGLASVKTIVEMYGGRIWVESEPGKGSTFRFTFHRRHTPSAQQNIEETAGSEAGQPEPAAAA